MIINIETSAQNHTSSTVYLYSAKENVQYQFARPSGSGGRSKLKSYLRLYHTDLLIADHIYSLERDLQPLLPSPRKLPRTQTQRRQ